MGFQFMVLFFFCLTSCTQEIKNKSFEFSGEVVGGSEFILFEEDTIRIDDGFFTKTIDLEKARYEYVQLDKWKWPKLIFIDKGKNISLKISDSNLIAVDDPLNSFLLQIDSILIPYTLNWNMEEDEFRKTIISEVSINLNRIDSVFLNVVIPEEQIYDLKQIEKLKVAHRTANFIGVKERNGEAIDRNIYDFIKDLDLNNDRLANQVNNRNFQYFYLMDKVSDDLPEEKYPFAAIDTICKYSKIESIRKMIIASILKSSFYEESVDHNALIDIYESKFGQLDKNSGLGKLYQQIQNIKPGNPAPDFGELEGADGKNVSIEDLRGRNVLLTVWGTWCPYCKEELTPLKDLIEKYGDKFTSVGISLDKDKTKWKSYIEENNWEGIHLLDPKRKSTFKSNYVIGGTNVHLLIDKDGVIISDKTMKPSSMELEKLILNLEVNDDF